MNTLQLSERTIRRVLAKGCNTGTLREVVVGEATWQGIGEFFAGGVRAACVLQALGWQVEWPDRHSGEWNFMARKVFETKDGHLTAVIDGYQTPFWLLSELLPDYTHRVFDGAIDDLDEMYWGTCLVQPDDVLAGPSSPWGHLDELPIPRGFSRH